MVLRSFPFLKSSSASLLCLVVLSDGCSPSWFGVVPFSALWKANPPRKEWVQWQDTTSWQIPIGQMEEGQLGRYLGEYENAAEDMRRNSGTCVKLLSYNIFSKVSNILLCGFMTCKILGFLILPKFQDSIVVCLQ